MTLLYKHIDTISGQSFMSEQLHKATLLRQRFAHLDIQVDGGVSPSNIADCARAGANSFVAGTAIIKSANPRATITEMRRLAKMAYTC